MNIYHIINRETWEEKTRNNLYHADSLDSEEFIHCCKKDQITFVIDNWFQEQHGLLLITIDAEKLKSPLIFEKSEGCLDPFPHIYGPVNLDAVTSIKKMEDEDKNK